MVTLSQIAKKTGVSVATVSLALRGRGLLARETAARIKALAHEMGYRPNPLLAALATKRFRSKKTTNGTPIAIFKFPIIATDAKTTPLIYSEVLETRFSELGYSAKTYVLNAQSDPKGLYREIYARMVQGIVILGSLDPAIFAAFEWDQFSVVYCGRYHLPQPFHTVRPNIFQSVKAAFNELRARGYKRIGFALGRHPTMVEDDEARLGAAMALEAAYLTKKYRVPVYSGDFMDREGLFAWFNSAKPDAIVSFSGWFYWELHDAGYRFPRDLGFITMHHSQIDVRDKIAGMCQNQPEVARQSVMLLDQLIRTRETGVPQLPMNLLISSAWVDGESVRPGTGQSSG